MAVRGGVLLVIACDCLSSGRRELVFCSRHYCRGSAELFFSFRVFEFSTVRRKLASRRERNAAQHFSEARLAKGEEALTRRYRRVRIRQRIEHYHQLIRIRALIAVPADG